MGGQKRRGVRREHKKKKSRIMLCKRKSGVGDEKKFAGSQDVISQMRKKGKGKFTLIVKKRVEAKKGG